MAGVPVIGQQQAMRAAAANQMVAGCYLSLVPVVAGRELEKVSEFSDRAETLPGVIADVAWKITVAAVAKLGIDVAVNGK